MNELDVLTLQLLSSKKDITSIWNKRNPTNPKKSKKTMGKSRNTIRK